MSWGVSPLRCVKYQSREEECWVLVFDGHEGTRWARRRVTQNTCRHFRVYFGFSRARARSDRARRSACVRRSGSFIVNGRGGMNERFISMNELAHARLSSWIDRLRYETRFRLDHEPILCALILIDDRLITATVGGGGVSDPHRKDLTAWFLMKLSLIVNPTLIAPLVIVSLVKVFWEVQWPNSVGHYYFRGSLLFFCKMIWIPIKYM